jgi:hypothetical protein
MVLSRNPGIDEQLAELQGLIEPGNWVNPHDAPARAKRRAGGWAAAMRGPYEVLRRVAPAEEEAVRRLLPELMPVLDAARGR